MNLRGNVKQKQSTTPSGSSASSKFFELTTAFGTHYVRAGKQVRVGLADGTVVLQPVENLNLQDNVAFRMDSLSAISLEDVSNTLIQSSPRYFESISTLFIEHDSKPFPFFSSALIDAVQHTLQYPAGKSAELFASAREAAASELRAIMLANGVEKPVTLDQIEYNWLGKGVVCPRNTIQVVNSLESVAPGLQKLLTDEFQKAYSTYLVIRANVVKKLHNVFLKHGFLPAGEGAGNAGKVCPKEGGISVVEEVNALIRKYISLLGTKTYSTPVLGIREVGRLPSQGAHPTHHGAHKENLSLTSGIVTESIDDKALRVKPLPELVWESNAIDGLIISLSIGLLLDGGERLGRKETIPSQIKGIPGRTITTPGTMEPHSFKVFHRELEGFLDFPTDYLVKSAALLKRMGYGGITIYLPGTDKPAAEKAKLYGLQILNGSLDAKYGLPRYTLHSIFECHAKLCSVTPTELVSAYSIEKYVRHDMAERAAHGLPEKKFTEYVAERNAIKSLVSQPGYAAALEQLRRSNIDFDEALLILSNHIPEIKPHIGKIKSILPEFRA